MKGYRTVISNVVMAVGGIAALKGIDIPADLLSDITAGIIAIMGAVNLFLRKITTGPMGTKE